MPSPPFSRAVPGILFGLLVGIAAGRVALGVFASRNQAAAKTASESEARARQDEAPRTAVTEGVGSVCVASSAFGRGGIAWGQTANQCELAMYYCRASGVSDCRVANRWEYSLTKKNRVVISCAGNVTKRFGGEGEKPLTQALEFAKSHRGCVIGKD
jgi:hypothetical protein